MAALAYGIYHYAPIGSGAVRLMLGIGFAATGIAMIAAKIGGRPLPAVLADLLRFGVGGRRFAGPVLQLVRAEPPAPPVTNQQSARRPRTRGERMPRVPRGWFRKREQKRQSKHELDEAKQSIRRESNGHRLRWPALFGAVGLTVALTVGPCTTRGLVAQEPLTPQLPEEIEFEPEPLVEGRRLYVERLMVTSSEATVVLKAATDLDINIQVFGGSDGRRLIASRSIELDRGERATQQLLLSGVPSFTFSWQDDHQQADAVTLAGPQLPHPLPQVEGELCDLQLTRLEWRPGRLSGSAQSVCVDSIDHVIELQTVSGYVDLTQRTVLVGSIELLTGTLQVEVGSRSSNVSLVPDGVTSFELAIGDEETTLDIALGVSLTADLSVPRPPLVLLTHHPQRTEVHSQSYGSVDPESGEATTETVTFQVVHPAYIGAEVVQRAAVKQQRQERLSLTTSIAADATHEQLAAPTPTTSSTQTVVSGDELSELFALLGWELN